MKHIKKYESYKDYKIGDYVLLESETKWAVDRECKIIGMRQFNIYIKFELQTFLKNKPNTLTVLDFEIGRKLTKDEIENYKIKFNTIKYNL